MSKTKKINPRRRPISEADLYKAQDTACHLALAIFLTVMKDKMLCDNDQIVMAWKEFDKLSEEIKEGRVNLKDLVTTLDEEYNISLK